MKKLINAPAAVVDEMLDGLAAAYPGLRRLAGHDVIVRADLPAPADRPVAVVSGGGSGHEPAHAGYVGRGMLAAAVAGDVFTSPSPDAVLAAVRAAAGARGALLVVKNYTGDRLNFGLAAEMARADGIPVEMVLVADDAALAGTVEHAGRRGLAGAVLVHKIAGTTADGGASLADVAEAARGAAAAVRTMGVALTPCTVPAAGRPGFALADDEIELGLGIHGEPGVRRGPLEPADALVDRLLAAVLADLAPPAHARLVLLVNNLGGTPTMELAVVARHAVRVLERRGFRLERVYLGTFLSALEMAGVSLSVLVVDDGRLARLDAATDAPAWPNAAARPRIALAATFGAVQNTAPGPPAPPPAVETRPAREPVTAAGRTLSECVRAAAARLLAEADRLTQLDQAVGDGDLGISLARGARAVLAELPTLPLDDPPAALHGLGVVLQRTLGGTSGPLYGVFFLRATATLRAAGPDKAAAWATAFQAGCAAVSELGGAARGDRTMLDALLPAADAFAAGVGSGRPAGEALRAAAAAAREGAAATAAMRARRGRSSYLADRVLGHPDPGAEAAAVWIDAVAAAW
jgi:dihydroxyacetone kinase